LKAKKAGETISNDSYELEVVPVDVVVKRQLLSPELVPAFEDYSISKVQLEAGSG
jgi:hypothetical protein